MSAIINTQQASEAAAHLYAFLHFCRTNELTSTAASLRNTLPWRLLVRKLTSCAQNACSCLLAVVTYDIFLTLSVEVEKIWRQKYTGTTVLWVLVRSRPHLHLHLAYSFIRTAGGFT